jgi:hypothetical protein
MMTAHSLQLCKLTLPGECVNLSFIRSVTNPTQMLAFVLHGTQVVLILSKRRTAAQTVPPCDSKLKLKMMQMLVLK